MQVSEVTRGVFAAFNTDGTGTVSKQLFIRFLANRGLLANDQRLEVRVTLDRFRPYCRASVRTHYETTYSSFRQSAVVVPFS